MKKKRSIRTRFLAAGFVLLLLGLGIPLAFAKGEEQIAQDETPVDFIEIFKTDYAILNPDYWELYEYKYISKDEKVERWYCSQEPKIDGLMRTEEKRILEFWNYEEGEKCDIKEEHAHLYMVPSTGLFIPAFNEELLDDRGWYKLKGIVKLSKEAAQILNDYELGRLSDNLVTMPVALENAKMNGRLGVIYLVPKRMSNDKMDFDIVFNDGSITSYTEDMNGYLINGSHFYAGSTFDPENDKTLTIEKREP